MGLLGKYNKKKQQLILIREFSIALLILLAFNYFGAKIFKFLGISPHILGMAGGILLLLIAISMIFPTQNNEKGPKHEPIIVPLATPVIAGPGSISSVMLFSSKIGNVNLMTLIIFLSMLLSCLIALGSSLFKEGLGEKGLIAFERLGGMIVALIAVQMFANGTIDLVKTSFNL